MFLDASIISTIIFLLNFNVQCAKIFGVFNIASVSHQLVFQPIWKELSLRGHEVTVLTPNPLRDPKLVNLTEIDLNFLYNSFEDFKPMFSQTVSHWDMLKVLKFITDKTLDEIFQHHEVMKLIKDNNTEFDVVLAEAMIPAVYAFAAKFNCPLIGVASLSTPNSGHEAAGNPNHPILYPDVMSTFTEDMTFLEKIEAVLYEFYQRYFFNYELHPTMNRILKKYFGEDIPKVEDIARNMSMLFLNTNPILHGSRPHGPNIIQLGRMHLKSKRPLPEDLKIYLDNSKRGVIYFSLGSNVKSIYLDKDKRRLIMQVFSELPYDILWKFEDDELEGKPTNVKIYKWLPQQDLLGHPNIKLFITQAGLQSFEEAIDNGVPLLAIPFIADQYKNAARIVKLGIGLQLSFPTLTKETFKKSILKVVDEPRYKDKVLEIRALLQDEPNSGLDRAVWWTEYVIRNKGAPYFRNRSVDLSWQQFLLLDVFGILLGVSLLVLYVVYKVVKFVTSCYGILQKDKAKML